VNIKSLIVRFTAREEIPRKFPREPHVFPIIVTFAKPQVFYYLMSDAKIFDIIYQLSSLLECDPTVCLPEKNKVKSKVTRGQAALGDKPSSHTPTRVIIV
jgi:hypothetical protein